METLPAADAVESLIREYGKLVFHTIYALTNDWDLSQDLTQETFLAALRAIDAARQASGPHFHARAWLMRIALNLVRMQRRRDALIRLVPFSQAQREDDEGVAADSDGVQEHASSVQPAGYGARTPVDPADVIPEREAVRRALASVPPPVAGGCGAPAPLTGEKGVWAVLCAGKRRGGPRRADRPQEVEQEGEASGCHVDGGAGAKFCIITVALTREHGALPYE